MLRRLKFYEQQRGNDEYQAKDRYRSYVCVACVCVAGWGVVYSAGFTGVRYFLFTFQVNEQLEQQRGNDENYYHLARRCGRSTDGNWVGSYRFVRKPIQQELLVSLVHQCDLLRTDDACVYKVKGDQTCQINLRNSVSRNHRRG